MKRKVTLIIIMLISLSLVNLTEVNAKEKIYTNKKGVDMTYRQRDMLSEIYSDNYVEFLEQEDFNEIKNYKKEDFTIKNLNESYILPMDTSHSTGYKDIKITKVGNHITLLAKWKIMPQTRSYDVLGIRFDGPSLSTSIKFKQIYTQNGINIEKNEHYYQSLSRGFGTSFKLPTGDIESLESYIEFNFNNSGRIYGTYQHAQKSVTLAQSQNYTISPSGYGGVLNFDSTVRNNYDAMGGVYIDV